MFSLSHLVQEAGKMKINLLFTESQRRPTSPQAKQNSWPESKQEGSVQIGEKKKKDTIETSLNTTWRLVFMRGFDFGRVGLIKSPAPPTLVFLVCSPLEVASPRLCPQHSTFCLPLTVNTEGDTIDSPRRPLPDSLRSSVRGDLAEGGGWVGGGGVRGHRP